MVTERNLLFAVLAFESEFLDLTQLTSACRAWAENKSRPLADLLVARGWLTVKNREFIDELLERKLAKHQNDARVTLNSVVRGDVCDAIKEVADSDIQQSLSSWPSGGPVLVETLIQSEEDKPKSRYTWISEVGHGGLGKVWLARDNDLAREIALKEIRPDKSAASQNAVRRLIKEAQITGQLQHPNIVPVYEVNRGSRPFYTMKLVKGETLAKAIRRHHEQSRAGHEDPLSLPRLLNVFVNVCEALAYAHSRGIIHRDLKPENIVLGDYGEAIVLDWGLAKQIGSADEETAPVQLTEDAQSQATRQGATPGTPAYMSPEQAAGRVDLLDQRTDIYGLGTILFEILTGHPPHRTNVGQVSNLPVPAPVSGQVENLPHEAPRLSLHDLLQRICEAPTPRARDVDPTISRELDAVCATAMSKKRDERYLDAKALAADVKRSLAHQPVSVYRTGAWERLRLWRRRNPVVASLSLFLAVSLLTGSVVSTLFGLAANREAGRANRETKRADAKADEARRNLYAAHMNFARRSWEISRVGLVRDSLEKTRPQPGETDLREFEWHYWDRLCRLHLLEHSHLLEFKAHTNGVGSVAFSADGKSLASAGWPRDQTVDHTVKVWDAKSGHEMLTLKGHTGAVSCVAFNADGNRLASASHDSTVKVWDAKSGQETLTLKGHTGGVESVVFSADGERLATACIDKTVKVWDAKSGLEILTLKGHAGGVTSVAFSADGKRLASASEDQTVKVWDATSGQETFSLKGHTGWVTCVALSADGKRLASASFDQTVKVWDATSGQETLNLKGHTGYVMCVAFSADGKRLASASLDQTVKVWDAGTGEEMLTLSAHTGPVTSVAFGANGMRLASASLDQAVMVWHAKSGQGTVTSKENRHRVKSVAFSRDGKCLASGSNLVQMWYATTGQKMLALRGYLINRVTSAAYSPDAKRLASDDGQTVNLWDTTTGEKMLILKGHTDVVDSVAYSPDGKRLASASADQTVKIWDATSGQETLTLKGHTAGVRSVAFSPDGKRLVSASADQTVKQWDTTSGQETLTLKGHTSVVTNVVYSSDGKWLASASGDHTVKVWDALSGQEMLTLSGHAGEVTSVAFSPNGKRLASASDDGTVKLWDTTSGLEMLTLSGHTDRVTSVAFSGDGERIASASDDGTVKVWGELPLTLELQTDSNSIEGRDVFIGR